MRRWLRRLRGMLGIGSLWGVAGAIVGALIGAGASASGGSTLDYLLMGGVGAGAVGFVLGTSFAGLLTLMDGNRTLDDLPPSRAALWGAVAGATVPIVTNLVWFAVGGSVVPIGALIPVVTSAALSYAGLTALLAAGTVALARRAPEQEVGSGPARGQELPRRTGPAGLRGAGTQRHGA